MAEKKKDRHRPGYYKDYAMRTGRKDRHRKGYYRKYNLAHPERIAWLLCDVPADKPWSPKHPDWFDEYGRLIKDFGNADDAHPFSSDGLGQD